MDIGQEEALVREIRTYISDNYQLSELSDDELEELIDTVYEQKTQSRYLSIEQKLLISQQVFSSIRGNGILDTIMNDDSITEVMINGPYNVFIEKDGKLVKMDRTFENEHRLEDVIQRIVGKAGREVNQSNPICDTRLDDSRVNVVLPPVALCGPTITIRKFSKEPMTVEKLIRYGSLTREIADKLELLVKARYNIFICGGTGSGKTTFLNALSNYIPKDERVITIEDSAELQIEGVDNLVRLETRNASTAGASTEITIKDLIKSSLRMRPDRIVVGEVRGGEALDMLQAMNTGHDGSLSTGHANSTRDMLSRLETMVLQGAEGLPLPAIRQQIASAVDIIIHLSRLRDHSRKTMEICEVCDYVDGEIQLNPLYRFREDEKSTLEKVSGQLVRTPNPMRNVYKLQLAGIKTVI